MGTERVDKTWAAKGIDTYSVDAILGTLKHYGVPMDEAAFRGLALEDFPLGIAMRWHEHWKGTGQFSRFPAAASEELWRRWLPEQLAPTDLALALIKLLEDLQARLEGRPDEGTLETRFKVVEAYLPRIPEAKRRDRFIGELIGALSDWMEVLDGMAEALVEQKLDALADRVVSLEEALLPERLGISSAIVQAERGDEAGAIAAISAIAVDPAREARNRLSAIHALIDFKALSTARTAALAVFDVAEQSKELELLSGVVEALAELLELDPGMPERHELRKRIEALAAELEPRHGQSDTAAQSRP